MTIVDVALAIQIHIGAKGSDKIGVMESWRAFLRLCAFAPILAAIVGLLELAGPEGQAVVAALQTP